MKYTAIEKSDYINKEMKNYIKSTFQLEDREFRDLFNQQIDNVQLMKGPYISISHPFTTGNNIEDLISMNILSKEFLKMNALHLKRPLYKHQEESIIKANKGLNLVVSTGTGSGKTESFMIPVLNEICKDIEKGIVNRGVQAMFLYPMNALANDQRERLREILESYPEITFGFYTGETETNKHKAISKYQHEFNRKPLENEIISREEIQKNPPNILFTNYSMLEFLLLRPNDKNIFNEENTKLWKYIILDEAHVYRGALGIEISMLLKRLQANIKSEPKFILTSATLATKEEDYPAVIDFAQRLTSQEFNMESIVLADRFIRQRPSEIINLELANLSKLIKGKDLVKKLYRETIGKDTIGHKNMLYEIIIHSDKFFEFVDALEDPQTIDDIVKILDDPWNQEFIIDFIDLLSFVNSGRDTFILDVKYHTFLKTLDGSQVTIKPDKVMYLRKTHQHKHYLSTGEIEYLKTFDLGVCKYCKSSYLIGRIVNDVFYKLEDEELYEQYDETYQKGSDILLLTDKIQEEDEFIKFKLCNKCGHITDTSNLNGEDCTCHESYKFHAFKKVEKEIKYRTNITECYSCGAKNNQGIVESFYIGKDSASALIAQLLYKKMGTKKEDSKINENKENDLFDFSKPLEHKIETKEVNKQIIAFSDSRQQASYFATYFENRHTSFLRKRLITKMLENVDSLNIDELLMNLEYEIEKNNLFLGEVHPSKQAWISVLYDLLDIDRKYSLSGLGLVCFHPKVDFSRLNESLVHREFGGMNFEDFKTFVYYIIDSMRYIPAIDYFSASKLTFDERREYLLYRSTDKGGISLSTEVNSRFNKSILPKNKRGNAYSKYMMKCFGLDEITTNLYLEKVCNFLFTENDKNYISRNGHGSFSFDYKGWIVKNGSTVDWYMCTKCGTVTHLNINNVCVKGDCDGYIDSCDPQEIFKDNYYFKEYLKKDIERIRIEEHTAQLTHEKARSYQKDFKNGEINILSSSTTFEMGVDIGDLDTVYMRNVPPTPANYIQRAGRAGRRQDTAAYVITFCSSNSHDYTYFESPRKMIQGKVEPPYFKVENEIIIYRHILSSILSDFFSKNSDLFENPSQFFEKDGISLIKMYLEDHKEQIIKRVSKTIYPKFREDYSTWKNNMIDNPDSPLMIMKMDYENERSELDKIVNNSNLSENVVAKAERRIKQLGSGTMINYLSKNNVVPKYGFPIDTVNLEIPTNKNYDIQRDLSTAISEYAPESEVIVDKKKYKSRYISNSINREALEYYYKICDSCGRLIFSVGKYNDMFNSPCENCGEESTGETKRFIKPVFGFIAENDEVKDRSLKPKRTYSSDYYYVGNSKLIDEQMEINNIVSVKSAVDNHLALLNESNFFTCGSCGYTEISNANSVFPSIEKNHNIPRIDYECKNTILFKTSLGHNFKTDVVIIEFNYIEEDYNTILSVLFAILEGMSNALDIERFDISGIIQNLEGKQQMIIFDSVPGGAGHVKRLLNRNDFKKVIESAYSKVNQECCDETSSCYNCLRNFNNQRIHSILKRGKAKDFLEKILEGIN